MANQSVDTAAGRAASSEHALGVLEFHRMREILTAYAVSPLGRRLAASVEPIRNLSLLRRLHQETEEMRALSEVERVPLAGLHDVCGDLADSKKGGQPVEPGDLYRVVELLRAGLSLRQVFERHRALCPGLCELAQDFEDLPELREQIPAKIDARDGVRDDASEKLLLYRTEIEDLRKKLRERTAQIRERPALRKCFQHEGVTLRFDRYVLPVKAEYRTLVKGRVRERSQSGSTLFIEPEELLGDGDRLVRLLDQERDEVTIILWDLTRSVREHLPVLRRLQKKLARVDLTFAKAGFARAFSLSTPEIDESGELDLRQARHPYLLWLERDLRADHRSVDIEALHRKVVPLDVHLDARGSLLIITGPNTGGKTVALKTIGLNVLLALSGLPISADPGGRVPNYSSVFVDIGDEQSIEQSLSTFSSHLKQIVEVLRSADQRSLILLDELGSGTDPLEGAALGKALLDVFRERGWTAIITTHLGSLKEYAYLHDGVENAAMEFDPRSLRPTYRLLLGVPGSSNALAIASRLGVDESVIAAAQEEISREEAPTREIISQMERSKRRVEKERRRAEKVRKRVQGEKREYEDRLSEIETRREMLDLEADLEVDRLVREAKAKLESIAARLKSVPNSHRPVVDELLEALDQLLIATPLGEKREAFAKGLRKGDPLFVPKFDAHVTVRKINKGERVVTVLIGGIPTEISFDDISWIEAPPGEDS